MRRLRTRNESRDTEGGQKSEHADDGMQGHKKRYTSLAFPRFEQAQATEVVAFPRASVHARPVAADDVATIVSRKMQCGK